MTIMNYYYQSELSLAAYSTLHSGISGEAYMSALEAGGSGMSSTQATQFASEWVVVDQYTDQITGFSATVFERDGQRYLAVRGTEITDILDFIADYDLVANTGVAANQTVALFNYMQQLMGEKGLLVPQLQWDLSSRGYILTETDAVGLLDSPISTSLTISGHSLGGHLAMAFGRLYPEFTSQIYTYNAPGFGDAAADEFFSGIDDAIARAGSSYQEASTTNLSGTGWDIIAYADHGTPRDVFLESNSHSVVKITDSLAVYNLIATLAPNLALEQITPFLEAASHKPELSNQEHFNLPRAA